MTDTLATRQRAAASHDTGMDVVTGAFSYSGGAIASALIKSGRRVRTMTDIRIGRAATPLSRCAHSTSTTNWVWSNRSRERPPSTTRTGFGLPGVGSTTNWPSPTPGLSFRRPGGPA